MIHSPKWSIIFPTAAILIAIAYFTVTAGAQLASNQTTGFGNGSLVTFTYLQNFDCVDQPTLDLDFNGIQPRR